MNNIKVFFLSMIAVLVIGCTPAPTAHPATSTLTPSPEQLQEAFHNGENVICPLLPSSTDPNAPALFTIDQCKQMVDASVGNDDYSKISSMSVQIKADQIPDKLKRAFYNGVLNMCLKARTRFGDPSAPLMFTDIECGNIVTQAIDNNYFEQRNALPTPDGL